jgi:hypothetical protein
VGKKRHGVPPATASAENGGLETSCFKTAIWRTFYLEHINTTKPMFLSLHR